jgi:hypothetical protein
MITIPATLALEHVDEPQVDGDTDADHGNDGDGCVDGAGELGARPDRHRGRAFVAR